MRIISGQHKGRTIVPPRGFKARPTTDFAKESLFNILANNYTFSELQILDLFAGTGGISFEFASRGCAAIDSVEIEPLHYSFIKRTALDLGFKQMHVMRNDAFKFLKFCTASYDIIFADPTYTTEGIEQISEIVLARQLLKPDGMLIVEHSDGTNLSNQSGYKETRHYGGVNFSFFE